MFQQKIGEIFWKMHFNSSPKVVFKALSTADGRERYWAESAKETNGIIHFRFIEDVESKGRVLVNKPIEEFSCEYFGSIVTFKVKSDGKSGTDLELHCKNIQEEHRMEIVAGWVSVLMAMKASVDFNIDLRNHDPERTWFKNYADN